jgi:hypothetical protein
LSASALSNLWHLEGETITVNAEGATHPDVVVINGRAPLTRAVGYAVAGLKYHSRLQTMRIEAGAMDGTAQAKVKRINEVTFRVLQSLGGEAGPDFSNMVPLKYRTTSIPMGEPPPIGDDDCRSRKRGYRFPARRTPSPSSSETACRTSAEPRFTPRTPPSALTKPYGKRTMPPGSARSSRRP